MRLGQRVDGLVLAENGGSSGRGRGSSARRGRRIVTCCGGMRGDLGDDLLDLGLVDDLLLLRLGQDALGGTGFVDHVDGLVRQVAVVDVTGRQFDGRLTVAEAEYLMPWCSSKRAFRPLRISTVSATDGSTTSIFWKRRDSARVLLEDAAELGVGGGADALQLARATAPA